MRGLKKAQAKLGFTKFTTKNGIRITSKTMFSKVTKGELHWKCVCVCVRLLTRIVSENIAEELG